MFHSLRAYRYQPKRFGFNRFCHRVASLIHPEITITRQQLGIAIRTEVLVPDSSFYEGRMNLDTLCASDAKGIIAKASQGDWSDVEFLPTWQNARGRKPRGPYHFFDPNYRPSVQVDKFSSLLRSDQGELPLTVDWEAFWSGPYSDWRYLYDFLEGMKIKIPGCRQQIYTGYYYWQDHSPNPLTQASALAYFGQYDLWLAWYTLNFSVIKIPRPWTMLKWLQFSESGDGEKYGAQSKGIDLNYYYSTEVAYVQDYHLGSEPPPPASDIVTHPFPGVTVTEGRRYGSSFRLTAVERTAIEEEHITAPGTARTVEEIEGDIVSNGGDFNMTTYQAVGLLRSEGREFSPQADSEPALAFDGAGNAWIDHRTESWWTDALGLKRYLVLGGVISPNTSPAWDGIEPRTIFGLRADGTRLILNVAGRQPDQVGITLYQAAAIMIEFGADRAADGDGGDSVQSRVGSAVFLGTTQRRKVADFYTIKISIGGDMAYRYSAVWAAKTRSVKKDHIVSADTFDSIPAGVIAQGDELFIAPTDIVSGGTTYQKAGDQWLHVRQIGSRLLDGWTAIIHLGVPQMDLTDHGAPPDSDDFFTANFNVEIINNETGARYTGLLTGKVSKVA